MLLVLIAARIMWSNRRVRRYRPKGVPVAGSHWEVIETMIQSAAIYSAALISLLGTYLANSNAQYVCLDTIQPLIVRCSILAHCPRMSVVGLMTDARLFNNNRASCSR